VDAWDFEHFADYLADAERSVFLTALDGKEIAGYAVAHIRQARAELDSIAVGPAHRKKHIALQLMRRILGTLRRRGFESVFLSVRADNAAAIRLYQKFGFERFRSIECYYEDGAPALRMKLKLIHRSTR